MFKQEIIEANAAYRNGNPILSDEEYDFLLTNQSETMSEMDFDIFLKSLAETKGSFSFGDYVIGSLKKVKYEDHNLSEQLVKMGNPQYLFCSAKIDGCSFVAHYEYGKFVSCSSKGDGSDGTDWTDKARHILPATITTGNAVDDIRGEFTLTGDSHVQLGFKNRRNGTVGLMNSNEVDPAKLVHVKAFAYQVLNCQYSITTQFEQLFVKGFHSASFVVGPVGAIGAHAVEEELKKLYLNWQQSLSYDIDGIVISSTEWTNENDKFFPENKVAFKVNSEGVSAKVIDIVWELSKGRLYIPVYHIEPTEIDGVTVSKVTANNARFIQDLGTGIGSVVKVIRSGCVIPKVIGVVSKAVYDLPTICPECGSTFTWNKVLDTETGSLTDGAHLQCPNVNCGETRRVEAFIKALDIENVSYKRLVEWGVTSFDKLLTFKADDSKLQVMFYEDLYFKMFNRSIKDLMRSMTCDGFGTSLFDKLYAHCGNSIFEMSERFRGAINNYPESIGARTVEKAASDWFRNEFIVMLIISDSRYKEPVEATPITVTGKLSGTFLITGTLSKGRKHFESLITANGGTISSSVSKNLNYLLVGEDAGSKLDKARKLNEVTIINEDQFNAMIALTASTHLNCQPEIIK